MNLTSHLLLAVEGAALALLVGVWALIRYLRSRRKSPEEIERLRRMAIHRRGRITSGQLVDFIDPEAGKSGPYLTVYKYEIGGVDYEVAQDITALPTIIPLARKMLGRATCLKYDPQRPTNSMIACEEWCGIRVMKEDQSPDANPPTLHLTGGALGDS